MRKRTELLDCWIVAALIAGNLILLGPWLGLEFSDQPWNNGYIYVGIARMFRDLPWTWSPLHYGGAPFHYLYPPLFHVLVVALASLAALPLGRAFHLVTGIGYAITPACLYILARRLFPARLPAILGAVALSVFPSPVYVLAAWRAIAHPFANAPWPFVSLVRYDEAGHAFALPLALLAIAEAWRNRWRAAALLAGAVFLTNWPGLIGLGFMLAGLAVARFSPGRVAGIAGTAYGLAAFWMTPGYFASSTLLNRIVLRHTLLAAPWNTVTWIALGIALAMICLSLWPTVPRYMALPAVWTALVGLVIVTYTLAGNYLLPSPHRYMLEFNAGLIVLLASLLAALPARVQTAVAILVVIAGTALSWRFLTHAWRVEPKAGNPREGIAYQSAQWLRKNTGGARVVAAGELDSTLSLWSDVPQVGGSGQDVSNFLMFAAEREVSFGCQPNAGSLSQLWLKATNAPLLVVPGAESPDYFHWYADTAKFAALPAVWNRDGTAIYQVPDFEPHDAVVVDRAALASLPPLHSTDDEQFLESYVKWAEGKRPVAIRWIAPDHAELDADLAPGEAILVKRNNDPGWRASGAAITSDPIGFQVIAPAPGHRTLTLRFGASWDQRLGRAITLLTIVLFLLRRNAMWIAACALVPAVSAWAVLMSSVPATALVAEQAFIRLQPPLINPGGIVVSPGGIVAIYGLNMGQSHDNVRVWVNDQPLAPDFHQANLVGLHLPSASPPATKFSVEVNGCRGNEFVVKTR